MLTALGRPAQLAHHVEGAMSNGCTVAEIKEVLLQTAVYCGFRPRRGLQGRRGGPAGRRAPGLNAHSRGPAKPATAPI